MATTNEARTVTVSLGGGNKDIFPFGTTIKDAVVKLYGEYAESYIRDMVNKKQFMTASKHRDKEMLELATRVEKFAKPMKNDILWLTIYTWNTAARECVRCGLCCMFDCDDHDAYATPISKQKWPGKGDHRCPNLRFDEKIGLYGCAMVSERSMVCEGYLCYYMMGENITEPSFFGKVPYSPDDEGNEMTKSVIGRSITCTAISTQVEWFVAYARKHALKKKDMARAIALKRALLENKKVPFDRYSPHYDELPIDDAFADHLIKVLNDIIQESSACPSL
jgi:hypothetical protein